MTKPNPTPELINQIRAEYLSGTGAQTLGKRYGLSARTVTRHCQDILRPMRVHIPTECKFCGDVPPRHRQYCDDYCRDEFKKAQVATRMADFLALVDYDNWDNIAHRCDFASRDAMVAWLRSHDENRWADRILTECLPETQLRQRAA